MTVRSWKETDISQIAELEKRCFSDPWSVSDFEGSFSLPFFEGVLLEEQGEIIGYACAVVVFEDGDVANVAVAPEYRGQGLGKRLMEELEQRAKARGAERLFLEVRESNASAIKLYTGRGFVAFSMRKGYYSNGENAIVMQKNL